MMNRKIAVLTLAGVMSAFSLNAFAAGESTSGTPSSDGTSQTRDPAPKATNADPDAASLPQGADGNTTDNGPTPSGSKAGGADKAGAAAAVVAVAVADRSSVCCKHYQSLHKQLRKPAVAAQTAAGASSHCKNNCGSQPAGDELDNDAYIQNARVIIEVHRQQAGSHRYYSSV